MPRLLGTFILIVGCSKGIEAYLNTCLRIIPMQAKILAMLQVFDLWRAKICMKRKLRKCFIKLAKYNRTCLGKSITCNATDICYMKRVLRRLNCIVELGDAEVPEGQGIVLGEVPG